MRVRLWIEAEVDEDAYECAYVIYRDRRNVEHNIKDAVVSKLRETKGVVAADGACVPEFPELYWQGRAHWQTKASLPRGKAMLEGKEVEGASAAVHTASARRGRAIVGGREVEA